MDRLSSLRGQAFDVAVIGGGIIGCGIARDAALRGLRVALFERRDFGSGTTSGSTRIVHGGLRYLEMFDFRLVRLDLRERETLLRIAAHLVHPLEFLIPLFPGDGASPLKLRAGLALYDALSFDKTLPSRRWLSAAEARRAEPALDRPEIRGAAAYYDARVDLPERLALENVLEAEECHAQVLNYCEATAVTPGDGRRGPCRVRVRDAIEGVEADVSARAVVNATGAWFERTAAHLTGRRPSRVRTTKGIHIVTPPLTTHAMVFYSRVDGRLLFAIPRNGLCWIGTTDTDYSGDPADARATRQDVQYVLDSARGLFPRLGMDDVLHTTAGVRALVRRRGSESSVSRMHRIIDGEPAAPEGVISVLGGKITGYRAIAEEVTDVVCRRLRVARRCSTAETPLPGARGASRDGGAAAGTPRHLKELYGTRAPLVEALAESEPNLARPLSPNYPDIGAQVVFGVRNEHCVHLSDVLKRRTLVGASADQGQDAAARVAALMGAELGWSDARIDEEVELYRQEILAAQAFRGEP